MQVVNAPIQKQILLIGPDDSKNALQLAVAVLVSVVVIGRWKLVCVGRQCCEGRVYPVLQVYFITQLQRISELSMYVRHPLLCMISKEKCYWSAQR